MGCGLIVISTWSIIYKLNYSYLVDCSNEIAYLAIPSGLFCFPCFWIVLSVHNDEKRHKFLPLVLILLTFALILIISATYIGFTHKLRVKVDGNGRGMASIETDFDKKMFEAMKIYEKNQDYEKVWNAIQNELGCCGVYNYTDWLQIDHKIPRVCCKMKNGTN